VEIVVTGRNVEVPDHFRVHVADKLARLERYDHKIIRMEVELFHERNRRQSKSCQRVEITGRGRGPVARAEACGPDFYAALDCAIAKLESRLRRVHDRRRVTYSRRSRSTVRTMSSAPASVATATMEPELASSSVQPTDGQHTNIAIPSQREASDMESLPGRIVRQKEHAAKPMSIDDALSAMELVGHDFYLFSCEETGLPSVVYRRKGYDYGLIRLA
jgi:ribosomal subunit interface protein